MQLLETHLGLFLLIFTRISGIFILAPVFGSKNTPKSVKVGLAFIMALIIMPLVTKFTAPIPQQIFPFMGTVISELILGLIIGYASFLTFQTIQMAGQFLDMQIGFGIVNVIDPQFGQSVPLVGSFKYLLAVLVFLLINGHHMLLSAVVQSFKDIPVQTLHYSGQLVQYVIGMISTSFGFALKLALPVVVAVLLTDITMAILTKAVPQVNVFVVGIPIKIVTGILILAIGLPFYLFFLHGLFNNMTKDIYQLLSIIQLKG